MGSTPLESAFFKDLFGTDEMRAVFEESSVSQIFDGQNLQ